MILAHTSEEFRERYLAAPLRPSPSGTEATVAELREQLEQIRAAGFANIVRRNPEQNEIVAAPVFGRTGDCIAAISVLGSIASVDMQRATPAVVAIARAVSRDVAKMRIIPGL